MMPRLVERRPGYASLERLLNNHEAAEALGVSVSTVIRLGDRGELPFIRVVARGDRRYTVSDVAAYIERRRS